MLLPLRVLLKYFFQQGLVAGPKSFTNAFMLWHQDPFLLAKLSLTFANSLTFVNDCKK